MSFNSRISAVPGLQAVILLGALALGSAGCASASKSRSLSDEERGMIHLSIASAALSENDPTGALIELKKAEELGLRKPELHHIRALAFHMKRDPAAAIEHARKAVEMNPEFSDANNTLGKLLIDAGKTAEGEKYLRLAANDPLYRDAYKAKTSLGIAAYRRGDFKTARKHFESAIQSDSTMSCVAHYYLGNVKLKESDVAGALSEYEKSIMHFCGKFPEGHYAKGIALMKSGRHAEARKQFLEVSRLFPNTEIARRAMDQMRYLP